MSTPKSLNGLATYPGPFDPLLDDFSSKLWAGQTASAVTAFTAGRPTFQQLIGSMVTICDYHWLRRQVFDIRGWLARLDKIGQFDSIDCGIRVEARGLCRAPQYIDSRDHPPSSDAPIYLKVDWVHAYTRGMRLADAAAQLQALQGVADQVLVECLASGIDERAERYHSIISRLEPYSASIPPRYVSLLAYSYFKEGSNESRDRALHMFEQLPEQDYYRLFCLPKLRGWKWADFRRPSGGYTHQIAPLRSLFKETARSLLQSR